MSVTVDLQLLDHAHGVRNRIEAWEASGFVDLVWSKDHRAWFDHPVDDVENRLGWLDLPHRLVEWLPSLVELSAKADDMEIEDVIVLGMGGSSLAPEVFSRMLGSSDGRRLRVLDSTHPAAVLAVERSTDLDRTLFVVSSKSGTTIETASFFHYFWSAVADTTNRPGDRFVAVTDPGTPLEELAKDRGFLATYLADPEVGGRYSALTHFGLVPAALLRADLGVLRASATEMADACRRDSDNPALELGAAMGELAWRGIDKLTIVTDATYADLPSWIEQLVAESTGKQQTGIVPIAGEAPGPAGAYRADRFFLGIDGDGSTESFLSDMAASGAPTSHVRTGGVDDLGGVMFMLEMATACSGAVLGINPFDQPDVQLAKTLAQKAIEGDLDTTGNEALDAAQPQAAEGVAQLFDTVGDGDYFCVQAFLEPTTEVAEALEGIRSSVRARLGIATSVDFGPRFLHSTGQLHKGGPNEGLFLQIVDDPVPRLEVPESSFTFGRLIAAQARGDLAALADRDRRVVALSLEGDVVGGLRSVAAAIDAALGG